MTNVNVQVNGNTLIVTGQVQDTNPTADQVSISGAASGSAQFVDSQGDFQFTTASFSSGALQLVATPPSGMPTFQTEYVNAPNGQAPYIAITGITYGHQRSITITGVVSATDPAGLTVDITGVANGIATTNAEGNFSITLTASGLGNVNAQTADEYGASNVATEALSVPPPQIDSLAFAEEPGNSFIITGHVNCPDPQGLTVNFGGEVVALDGQQATVGADGWFRIVLTIPTNENGVYTAQVTDYWGQQSNLATDTLNHSN